MTDFINAAFPVLMFSISTLCVLVLLLYFFKKENLLRRLGFMKEHSLYILWSSLAYSLMFGLFGTMPPEPGEFTMGIQAFLCIAAVLAVLITFALILSWRGKIQAS